MKNKFLYLLMIIGVIQLNTSCKKSFLEVSPKGTVLESNDVDADIALFKERGVDIAGEVQEAPWGRFVTFEDPDGNGIVLQETAGPQA